MTRPSLNRCMLAWLLLIACTSAWGADLSWPDIESRIQYSYYVEDRRALQDLADSLDQNRLQGPLRNYYSALVNYRIAQLTAQGRQGESKDAVGRCISNLDEALKEQTDFPDGLALQSACLTLLTSLSPLRLPLIGPRGSHQLDKALKLAPRNPRVLLLDAVGDYEGYRVPGGKERALAKLQRAVTAFEEERRGVERIPGWGAADAYTLLARSYLEKGDAIAARGALENALLIAPEFALAKRLLTRITSG
jgi:tetratricopeptide (TPR) repeat protein